LWGAPIGGKKGKGRSFEDEVITGEKRKTYKHSQGKKLGATRAYRPRECIESYAKKKSTKLNQVSGGTPGMPKKIV